MTGGNWSLKGTESYLQPASQQPLLPTSAPVQPDDCIEVQMVGGFIQHQQGRLHEECPE